MKSLPSRIEALEARIAPALVLSNPLFDILGGAGQVKQSVDLSKMFDATATSRTHVKFVTNVDMDAGTPGLQGNVIEIELLDDVAPLTVQNFINYVNAKAAAGDYDNTIIHRQVDFNQGGKGDADFIQGGGFEFGNLGSHIPTGVNLHNEYSLPNARGTIAMGKIGGDPNSASSEWFINAADNSSVFGVPASGSAEGYTVFGNVLSGMDVVDRISQLTEFDLSQEVNGAFGQIPLQGGYVVGNPNFNNIPTENQFVRITDAMVIPGVSTGITYSAQVFEHGTTTPSTLLKTAVTGTTLGLTYSGRAGVADVVVTGVDASGMPVSDTFTVTLAPNLIAGVAGDGFQTLMVPGDKGTMKVSVTNGGSANFKGNVKVEFYLSQAGLGADTDGTTLDAADILLTTLPSKALSLAPGKSAVISQVVSIPAKLVDIETPVYRILTKVTPLDPVDQLGGFTDDDVARLSNQHALMNQFGNFSIQNGTISRTGAVLKFTQDDGIAGNIDPLVTLSLKGNGNGHVTKSATGVLDLEVSGTDLKTTLNALVGKGQPHLRLNDFNATTPLGTAALGLVDFDGFVTFSSGLKTATLGNLIGDSTFILGSLLPDNATKATIKLGRVQDYSFESQQPIASLTAIEWLDVAGGDDTIDALSLDKLTITGAKGGPRGDFEANIELSGVTPLAALTVAGFLKNSTVHTPGDIGKITLGGIDHSSIFAGTTARPDDLTDFTDERTIANFTIKGITGITDLFIDSQIAAQNIGTISVKGVDTDSGTGDFGFVADAIKSYNRLGGAKGAKLEGPGVTDRADDYLVQLL